MKIKHRSHGKLSGTAQQSREGGIHIGPQVDVCVCCGRIVPEGSMVCPLCEAGKGGRMSA